MEFIIIVVFAIVYCIFVLGYTSERKKHPDTFKIIDRAVFVLVVALMTLSCFGYI